MKSISNNTGYVHVAVAAIFDEQDRVLVSRRPVTAHQGGLWEFPGGKLEPGEPVQAGLERECREELGILIKSTRPLIRIFHDYADMSVLLDVWRVDDFAGEAGGREGQPIKWVSVNNLRDLAFPAANEPIIKSVGLPDRYLITPEPEPGNTDFINRFEQAIARGVSLVQFRAKQLSAREYRQIATLMLDSCVRTGARLILNASPALVRDIGAHGVHLTSDSLMALSERPLTADYLVGASCHSLAEVEHAGNLGLDFVVAAPVKETLTHPDAVPMGFTGLQRLTESASLPVYALGGMQSRDLEAAFHHGAQGIAAIRGLWP
jgi:8-oxo-dGTP diphosphatase